MSGTLPAGQQPSPPPTPSPPSSQPASPAQPGLTRGRRVALWIAAVAAAAAVIATMLVALFPQGAGLPEPGHPTPATAAQARYSATRTAQALQMVQPYTPNGIGPCDTVDPPFSKQNASYWQWGSNPKDVTCDPGGGTVMHDDSYIAFYGLPNGFPSNFTATLTVSFDSMTMPPDGGSCLIYQVTFDGGEHGLSLCDNGMWQSVEYSSINGLAQPMSAGTFVIVMQVSSSAVAFSVNNAQATPPLARGAINDITLREPGGFPVGGSADIASFVLTPLT